MNSRDHTDKVYIAPKTVNKEDKLAVGKDFKSGPVKESQISKEARLKKGAPEMNKYPVTRPVKWSSMLHNVRSRR